MGHVSATTPQITIPADLLPADGRFGCGPSKVRPEAVAALAAEPSYMGTSHRQEPVRFMVSRLRNGLAEMFALPDGYEIMLGNGGSTVFWDIATFGLIENRSLHASFGEFSSKFASASAAAPFLGDPIVVKSDPGTHPDIAADPDVDVYALTHNETSTGVSMQLRRPEGATDGQLVLVDATSAAGGLRFDPAQTDVYYFAPQKCLASDGGLWLAAVSPAAVERIERIGASGRWIPESLSLTTALENSRKDQTYNTPALATVFLAVQQVEWVNENGGLHFAAGRSDRSAEIIYGWAEASDYATPVRHRGVEAQPRGGHHRPRRLDRRPDREQGAAGQRHRRHRQLPQARPQPATGGAVPGDRPRRRGGPHRLHRPRRGQPRLTPHRGSPRQVMPDHVSHGHERLHRGSPSGHA